MKGRNLNDDQTFSLYRKKNFFPPNVFTADFGFGFFSYRFFLLPFVLKYKLYLIGINV